MALPRFSFSGWTSSRVSPQVNPAAVPIVTPGLLPPGGAAPAAPATAPGQLVATTNAANTNLPAWLQAEVDRLNAQDALRRAALGGFGGGGGAPAAPAFDPQIGAAAYMNAQANYNQQVFGMNQNARLAGLVQQRNLMSAPTGVFGFSGPFQAGELQNLDRQISDYQRFSLPTSGWVGGRGGGGGGRYINGLLNGTGYA